MNANPHAKHWGMAVNPGIRTMHQQQRSQHLSPTLSYQQQQTNHYNNQTQSTQYNNYYKHNMMKHNNGTMSADIYQQHPALQQRPQQNQEPEPESKSIYNETTYTTYTAYTNYKYNNNSTSTAFTQFTSPTEYKCSTATNYLKPGNVAVNHRIHQQPSLGSPTTTGHHSYSYGTLPSQSRDNVSRHSVQVSSPKVAGTTHEISNLGQPSLLTAQRSQGSRSAPFADINTMNEHNQQNNYYNNNQVQVSGFHSGLFRSVFLFLCVFLRLRL